MPCQCLLYPLHRASLIPVCNVFRSEEKQTEIEELRVEVRRLEARLRVAHRDLSAQQDKAELHSKFSAQYLAELEDLRAKHAQLQVWLPTSSTFLLASLFLQDLLASSTS